jgi:hypothetical protein
MLNKKLHLDFVYTFVTNAQEVLRFVGVPGLEFVKKALFWVACLFVVLCVCVGFF